jgi:hypothetical protein
VAVVSDVHANLAALDAVLSEITAEASAWSSPAAA